MYHFVISNLLDMFHKHVTQTFWISHLCLLFSGSLFELGITPVKTCSTYFVHAHLLIVCKTQCLGSLLM